MQDEPIAPAPKQDELLNELLDKITPDEKLSLLAKLVGYTKLPPDVDTILYDDYYLGHVGKDLYPCWRDWLKEFFYNPIQSKATIVTLSGALGIGKSYVSMLIMLIDMIRLSFHPDPFNFLGLNEITAASTFRFFNKDKTKAKMVLVDPFLRIIEGSPYFQEQRKQTGKEYPHDIKIDTAKVSKDIISEILFGIVLSEFNFVNPKIAEDMLSTALNRMRSRLLKSLQLHLWTHVIIDSSASQENSALNTFLKKNSWEAETISVTKSIWEAKSHLGLFFQTGSFQVYMGDNGKDPFIIPKGYSTELNRLDKDRILEVPNELLADFKLDIIKALQDLGGVVTYSGNKFFTNKERLMKAFSLPNPINESYIVDFFDEESLWDILGKQILSVIPQDRHVYGRIDLGTKSDATGVALAIGERAEYVDIEGKRVFKGFYRVPIIFQVTRYAGQETNIDKITDFFIALSRHRSVKLVTTDQYQSTEVRQKLLLNNIPSELYSVDRTAEAYITGKNLIYRGQVEFVDNNITKKEAAELEYFDSKVDHPSTGCFTGDTQVLVKDKLTGEISSKSIIELLDGKAYISYLIYSINPETKQPEFVNIKKVFKTKEVTELVKLEFGNQVYYCTPDHLILTTTGYVPASELTLNSEIISIYDKSSD